jgi:hypothetical protein
MSSIGATEAPAANPHSYSNPPKKKKKITESKRLRDVFRYNHSFHSKLWDNKPEQSTFLLLRIVSYYPQILPQRATRFRSLLPPRVFTRPCRTTNRLRPIALSRLSTHRIRTIRRVKIGSRTRPYLAPRWTRPIYPR